MTAKPDPPTKLIRNSTAEFLIFTAQDGDSSIEARYEDETIWLTQRLMAELFDVDVRTISEHLGNIFSSGELERKATIRKFRTTRRRTRCSGSTKRVTASSTTPGYAAAYATIEVRR
nr:MAG TPA: virulence protein [Caudoviricetes sp.]